MLNPLRHPLAAFARSSATAKLIAAGAVVIAAAAIVGVIAALGGEPEAEPEPAPAPEAVVAEVEPPPDEDELEAEDLGFPAFATKNTTRVAGPDSIANAAAVALAVYPSTGGVEGPAAVTLVDEDEWQAGIAAASLAAAPIRAPILVTAGGELPPLTENALRALDPGGSSETDGKEVFAIGAAARPEDRSVIAVEGANAAELAAAVDRLRQRLTGDPRHIVVAPADEPAEAMPAAAWAARSGDPVLFAQRRSLPRATEAALARHRGTPVYVLGSEAAIADRALKQIRRIAPNAERIEAEDPTASSIAFARYVDGSFGWDINDPGHGFVIAGSERPLDAAAAAPLSASGTWGPLLVVEDGAAVPADLRGYLLDLKPGYESDPTRAVYNHVWLIGDTDTLSVAFQAQVDQLAEVAPVTPGSGAAAIPAPPEDEPGADQQGSGDR